MRNPLSKRLLPELRDEAGKYIVIFLLMTLTIGFISGFLVADNSMIIAYNEGFTKYNVEDGYFIANDKLSKAARKEIAECGITIYEKYHVDIELTNGSTMRFYKNRTEIDTVCIMDGSLPVAKNQVAIDRMFAENNDLSIGDEISSLDGDSYIISGLVALPDYSCLFEKNSDTMFDATMFGIGIIADDAFAELDDEKLIYEYGWKYNDAVTTELEEKEAADALLNSMLMIIKLNTYVPRYQNQAITFTGEDMGGDKNMMIVLLYMLIAIMSFVFAITTRNTIVKESGVIGTLRASGYTKLEVIMHYMTAPVIVTLVSAIIGNVLGYTVFKEVAAGLYYGSYSLPTYVTVWNAEAFVETTVVPVIIMIIIVFVTIAFTMRIPILKFLRRDLTKGKKKNVIHLSPKLSFMSRFRMRVIFQNLSNYVMVFVGILFANLLLMFGLMFPNVLNRYSEDIPNMMFANYQYFLNYPMVSEEDNKLFVAVEMLKFMQEAETENEEAEKFSAYTLMTKEEIGRIEEVVCYGIAADSKYIELSIPKSDDTHNYCVISSAFSDKYNIHANDTITLKEKYEDKSFTFTVTGIYDYPGTLTLFMNQDDLNELFELGDGVFVGYFSNSEITDLDSSLISSVIDINSMTKITRQLMKSMGQMMYMVDGFSMIIFVVLIYLLSKMIIEKNAQSISMNKILGYSNIEIGGIYILSTTIVVVLSIVLSIPILEGIMEYLYKAVMMSSMNGWIPFMLDPVISMEMIVMGILTYSLVAVLEFAKIKKIPMDIALKNVE